MLTSLSRRAIFSILLSVALAGPCRVSIAVASAISPNAQALNRFLDGLGVESKWIAGARIDWETGLPNGKPETTPGKHTHCSAFVASAAEQLGVYILRPPEHGQKLLANAQDEWLASKAGRDRGWQPIENAANAQNAANQGLLVVAVYRNHHDDRPGHIAIVRPSEKTAEQIVAEGPAIIQAGSTNHTLTSVKIGFASHPAAWRDHEVKYYSHRIDVTLP